MVRTKTEITQKRNTIQNIGADSKKKWANILYLISFKEIKLYCLVPS